MVNPDGFATWAALILPHIEQANQYRHWDLRYSYSKQPAAAVEQLVGVYLCPGRPTGVLSTGDVRPGGIGDYAACTGTGTGNYNGAIVPATYTVGVDAAGVTIITKFRGQVHLLGVQDGTSSTLMVGEKHIRPNSLRGKNEDRSIFGGVDNAIRRAAGNAPNGTFRPLSAPSNQDGANANQSFGGPHSGVCQFVFCDGSVRTLSNATDLVTLSYLAGRNDGQVITGTY